MTALTSTAAAVLPPQAPGDRAGLADDDRISVLGDEITNKMFLAGMSLCSAIGLTTDEPVRLRLERAVADLDDALKDLRHLMVAVLDAPAGPGVSGT